MTENGRKRSRKSKLVPRDCADFVEDDLDLQGPPQKKLLNKIKKEAEDFIPQDPATHQFSVKVEVEDMDGSIPDEGSDYMKFLFSLSKEAQEEEPQNLDFADNSLLLEQKLVIPLPEDEKNCMIDARKTQKMLAILHKRYPGDKEAVMHTRNQWGRAFSEKVSPVFKKTPQESQLQAILLRWKEWTAISRSRESPYCYKCYVCENGWWSFTEFSMHIANHLHCKLGIETKNLECNIVAYEGLAPSYKDIDVHGKCLKCAKTFDHHLTNKRGTDAFYYCNYCEERFQTCSALAKHEGTCPRNPIRVLSLSKNGKDYSFSDYSCVVCKTVFLSNPDLTEHMTICHKVRSDEPIVTKLKTCKSCGQDYFNYSFHMCGKKHACHECTHCSSKFHNKQMLEHHLKVWSDYVQCRICDKFLQRSCMAAEHYALHSDNFLLVHRCLLCKKIKVFFNDETLNNHKSKYHRKNDYRRPSSDKIIMARVMVEQCMIEPVKRTPKILQPKTAARKQDPVKLTRGETMPQVRVYVPVHKKAVMEPPSENTTTAHDDTTSLRTDLPPSDTSTVHIKEEKDKEVNDWTIKEEPIDKTVVKNSQATEELVDDKKALESLKEVIEKKEVDDGKTLEDLQESESKEFNFSIKVLDNLQVTQNTTDDKVVENISNVVIKQEKMDDEDERLKDENDGRKDITNIMAELNEFLDIKPDIIVKKEEDVSHDETAQATQELSSLMSDDITKVFHASSTFAEELTDSSEHSKVYKISKTILETVVKEEIKSEPMEEDPISLDSSNDSSKNISESSATSLLNLEPEVILKAGYRKRKIYRCNKCDYSGFHREYKEHIDNHCNRPRKKECYSNTSFQCTKCNNGYACLKKYILHFEKHGYRYMSCPQCRIGYDSVSKLMPHVNNHIKNQFFKVQLLADCEDTSNRIVYQCKTCKELVEVRRWFCHWEGHLQLAEAEPQPPLERFKVGELGEHALHPKSLKEVLEILPVYEKTDTIYSKSCIVCNRVFERRNDCKRHLIEHLLEDAYANITTSNMLKCQICSATYKKQDAYKKHMRDHANLPIYQCGLCNKTFSDSSNFTKHKKIHNLKAFICDICSKKFQAKVSLEKHVQMHMKMDPITCDRCEKVFHDRSFYKRHCRQHHDKGTARYRCVLCREKFLSLRDKWDHMWVVHKQRKEEADCPVCGVSYRKFNDVKRHAYEVHGKQMTLSNLWGLVSKIKVGDSHRTDEGNRETASPSAVKVQVEKVEVESSDDDCLLIEEERETLVVYD